MLTVLPFTGVLTMGEALAGFSDSNIILIAALFVIGEGLVRTGVAQRLGDWLIAKAGHSEIRLIVFLMLVVCGLGATMSSTAVTAIFIPVALRIARSTGIGPSRLMMPISVAALISGMTTLVATAPNLFWADGDRPATWRHRVRARASERSAKARRHPVADRSLGGYRETSV